MVMVHIGRKVPKGFKEVAGSIHLGRGVWMLRMEPIEKVVLPAATCKCKCHDEEWFPCKECWEKDYKPIKAKSTIHKKEKVQED
jgi:hypothetical protein